MRHKRLTRYLERLPGAESITGLAAWPEREQAQGKANETRLAGEAVIAPRIDQPPQPALATDDGRVEGDVIYTRLTPIVQTEVAMLLLDIVQSTGMIQQLGDTVFTTGIMRLHRALSTHPLAGEMRFLKCTGDGFLAAYGGVMAAVAMARSLRFTLRDESAAFRLVVHWGRVKVGPEGDPLGKEVHRLFRVEAIRPEDCVQADDGCGALPAHGRIVITRAALDQLGAAARVDFELVGRYRLKGFDEPEEVWAEKRATG